MCAPIKEIEIKLTFKNILYFNFRSLFFPLSKKIFLSVWLCIFIFHMIMNFVDSPFGHQYSFISLLVVFILMLFVSFIITLQINLFFTFLGVVASYGQFSDIGKYKIEIYNNYLLEKNRFHIKIMRWNKFLGYVQTKKNFFLQISKVLYLLVPQNQFRDYKTYYDFIDEIKSRIPHFNGTRLNFEEIRENKLTGAIFIDLFKNSRINKNEILSYYMSFVRHWKFLLFISLILEFFIIKTLNYSFREDLLLVLCLFIICMFLIFSVFLVMNLVFYFLAIYVFRDFFYGFIKPYSISYNQEGLLIEQIELLKFFYWKGVKTVKLKNQLVIIKMKYDNHILLLPENIFESKTKFIEFYKYAKGKINSTWH